MLGTKVFVYYNLHKNTWSIRDCKTRKVIGHADRVVLESVKPKVSQAGRQRVLKEKRKNVHAGLEGYLLDPDNMWDNPRLAKPITYNPYKYEGFVYKNSEKPYNGSVFAILNNRSVTV